MQALMRRTLSTPLAGTLRHSPFLPNRAPPSPPARSLARSRAEDAVQHRQSPPAAPNARPATPRRRRACTGPERRRWERGSGGTRNAPASSGSLYAVVEVSRKRWVVALHAPDAGGIGLHAFPATDTAPAGPMDRARDALEHERGLRPRAPCGYEAGCEGFRLARRIARLGVETLVLDPASLPAGRRAKRVKANRRDPARMLRALTASDRGEPLVPGTVRVPSVGEEDRRRLVRQRTMPTVYPAQGTVGGRVARDPYRRRRIGAAARSDAARVRPRAPPRTRRGCGLPC